MRELLRATYANGSMIKRNLCTSWGLRLLEGGRPVLIEVYGASAKQLAACHKAVEPGVGRVVVLEHERPAHDE